MVSTAWRSGRNRVDAGIEVASPSLVEMEALGQRTSSGVALCQGQRGHGDARTRSGDVVLPFSEGEAKAMVVRYRVK